MNSPIEQLEGMIEHVEITGDTGRLTKEAESLMQDILTIKAALNAQLVQISVLETDLTKKFKAHYAKDSLFGGEELEYIKVKMASRSSLKFDESKLPEEYFKTKTTTKTSPDTPAIRKVQKETGMFPEGVEEVVAKSLQIELILEEEEL